MSVIHHSSFIIHHSRRGISLMEVLISIFILSIGLLGVAALIPIGKLAMIETGKSDRTGACGRAILREVKMRRMLDYTAWFPVVPDPYKNTTLGIIVVDPLGYANNLTGGLGGSTGLPRYTFNVSGADLLCRWRDDLLFVLPKDMKPPGVGDRPIPITDANGIQSEGNLSWFLTVAPSPNEVALPVAQRQTYSVAVVVCYKRVFSGGERLITGVTCDASPSYGGVGITKPGNELTGTPPLKSGEWVLLQGAQTTWYRVVSAGYDGSYTRATLVGPDWYGGNSANVVIVSGVSGVYTTTVKLDNDLIWSR